VWGWDSQPAHQLVVRQAGQRNTPFAAANKKTVSSWDFADHGGQVGGFHASQLQGHSLPWLKNVCLFAGVDDALADPYNALVRRQQHQEQHQQQETQQQPAPQLPLERATAADIIDVLEAWGRYAQMAQ